MEPNFVQRLVQQRIFHRDEDAMIHHAQRHQRVFGGNLFRHKLDHVGVDVELRQLDVGDAHLARQQLVDRGAFNDSHVDQDFAERALAVVLLLLQGLLNLRFIDDAGFHQCFAQLERGLVPQLLQHLIELFAGDDFFALQVFAQRPVAQLLLLIQPFGDFLC